MDDLSISFLNDSQFLNTSIDETNIKSNGTPLEVNELLKQILHENSREVTWSATMKMNEKFGIELRDNCLEILVEEKRLVRFIFLDIVINVTLLLYSIERPQITSMLFQLYKEHIKWELLTKKVENKVDKLKQVLSEKERNLTVCF